ncbi:PTS system, cellobiose-specific IIC component [Atopostipes suicloacalis DSM 15692]|uniref:Permease IIC component n=1 Tax=Atopostipes suicloacalis DSM 15692 TaxID=1121025 RepID=A0A1M4SIT4_9LACT|nr:PTS sugar transporter subunit IIC [Atopostipes suicloacalis]SHE32120.1 PTS system, cellobiose-specific IIC component [Atopostipes suicloacalis DSM 15692]
MNKFGNFLEEHIIPFAARLNNQRHIAAVRDGFITAFPLTMAGSIILLINNTLLNPDGFIADLLNLQAIFPNLADSQQLLVSVVDGTNNIFAIIIAYLVASNLMKILGGDSTFAGITSIAVFFIMYPPTINTEEYGTVMQTNFLGAEGLFVAMIIGLISTELLFRLTQIERLEIKMPEQVPPNVARSFSGMIPIGIVLVVFALLNFTLSLFSDAGLNGLVFDIIQAPLSGMVGNVFAVIVFAMLSNLLWFLGIHGPNTLGGVRDPIFAPLGNANTAFIAENGTTVGIPYPFNWGALNDGFANYGGSGMTLGLIIAIFLFSKREEYKSLGKLSILPGLFNINEPIIFGLPIVLNPLMIVPFVLTPVVNIVIGYFAISTGFMDPIGYGVPWTTPGPLIPYIGSGGDIMGLVVGLFCLVVSVAMYSPFVIMANAEAKERDDEAIAETDPAVN